MSTPKILKATHIDLPEIAQIHCEAMHTALLARVGADFLQNYFYPAILKSDQAELYVARDNGEIAGWVLYGKEKDSIMKIISGLRVPLLLHVLKQSLHDFPLLKECLVSSATDAEEFYLSAQVDFFHLCYIAVNPAFQGKGIGSILLNSSTKSAARTFQKNIVFLEAGTGAAYRFYKKNHYYDAGQFKRGKYTFQLLYKEI